MYCFENFKLLYIIIYIQKLFNLIMYLYFVFVTTKRGINFK